MKNLIPTWYSPKLLDIDLQELKRQGIQVLLFDLDNTIVGSFENKMAEAIATMLQKAKMDFYIAIITNNHSNRVKDIATAINVPYLASSHKPGTKRIRAYLDQLGYPNEATILVGDQLLTDVWCANQLGIKSLLVEPLTNRDLIKTIPNRLIDRQIRKKLQKNQLLRRLGR